MAQITIGGVVLQVPPMRFRQKVEAGPTIDRLNAAMRGYDTTDPSIADTYRIADIGLEIIAAAMRRDDPTATADSLRDRLEDGEEAGISIAVLALLRESGFLPKGEPEAVTEAKPSPSPRKSRKSSPGS